MNEGGEVLRENPQIQVTEQDYKDYNTMLRSLNEQLILLPQHEQDLFDKLHMMIVPEFSETVNRFVTNAVPTHGAMSLFLKVRGFNHSCSPNAQGVWNPKTREMQIELLEEVSAGQEITISYMTPNLNLTERPDFLQSHWGFVCQCPKCLAQKASLNARDEEGRWK
jgi:hypothetical protein